MPDLTGILSNRTNYRMVVAKQVVNRQRGSFEVLKKVQTFRKDELRSGMVFI